MAAAEVQTDDPAVGGGAPPAGRRIAASRIAFALTFVGVMANGAIAAWAYGNQAWFNFLGRDLFGDFLKHVLSFPGPQTHPSMLSAMIHRLMIGMFTTDLRLTHFHNLPLTVFITLGWRQLFAWIDPVVLYGMMVFCFLAGWLFTVGRYSRDDDRPALFALALFNYPMLALLCRGNLFAGIVAICMTVALCRRKLDWTAVLLLAVAGNFRPNVLLLALPLLLCRKEAIAFVLRTGVVGTALAAACLVVDWLVYPPYTIPAILRGLARYNEGYAMGPFGLSGSSLWGAVRQVLPAAGPAVGPAIAICTVLGLLPLLPAWLKRESMSYAAVCFLTMAACTLSTSVLADYHLLIFVVPIILLKREDPAFWPVVLGACWMLVPKHYNPGTELSWQIYFNPLGLIVASLFVARAYRGRRPVSPFGTAALSPQS